MNKLLVNSLPKSGTHLLVKLLESMGYQFSGANLSSTSLYGKNEWAKYLLRGVMPMQTGVDVGLEIAAVARRSWVINSFAKMEDKQFCGGHLPYSDCMSLLLLQAGIKPLHILRDPRDVLVSWAHYVPKNNWHFGHLGLVGLNLEQRVKKILYGYQSGDFGIESYSQILQRSMGWTRSQNVLVVRFEDLVGSRGGGDDCAQLNIVKQIATFAECEAEVAELAVALFGGTKVFRKGQIGSWREELSSGLADEINSVLEHEIVMMGYQS